MGAEEDLFGSLPFYPTLSCSIHDLTADRVSLKGIFYLGSHLKVTTGHQAAPQASSEPIQPV